MRFTMGGTPPSLLGPQQRMRSLRIEWEGLIETMRKHATIEASGPYTEQQLREMDHPYARRHGRPLLPLLPININTGRLLLSMRVMKRRASDGTYWQLQFMAPHSKFVLAPEGTDRMFARGYWLALRRRYEEEIKKVLRRVRTYGRA